jgi:hypothetical protein
MRRQWAVLVVAGAAAVGCSAPPTTTAAPGAGTVARAGTWGRAIEVPGLRSLNRGGHAQLASVSCGSAGDCVAGGSYVDGSGHAQAFLVARQHGIWRKAFKVPGSGTLNAGGAAQVTSVSCAEAGSCSAVGYYKEGSSVFQVFVVSERNGTWGKAMEMPGMGTLNTVDAVAPETVSCASPGNCAAFGGYMVGGTYQAFVGSEENGTWGRAIEVPGLGALNSGGNVGALSVSCGSAGDCSAAGDYKDGAGHTQAFVVSEKNGTWGRAIEVPGLDALNSGGDAAAGSVSCGSAGNCVAVGGYHDGPGHSQAFLVSQANGTWGNARRVPGTGALNSGGLAYTDSVSCVSAGDCAAAGSDTRSGDKAQTFAASEKNGVWGNAIQVPGSGILKAGRYGSRAAVSCATAGNCAAGLTYTNHIGRQHAFVASETNGTWGHAIEIPGLGTLNAGRNASITSLSCGSADNCAAVGTYTDANGHTQAFIVNYA